MFTSSIRSFRHAPTRSASRSASRLGSLGRRAGVLVAAAAFSASLASPAAAQPSVVPTAPTPVEVPSAVLDAVPAGIATAAVSHESADTGAETGAVSGTSLWGGEATTVRSRAARMMPVMPGRVVGVAAAQAGDPYVYGAAGPNAFDCSGLTSFVYRVAARRYLPHSSSAQYGATQRVSRAAARPGDLVFFHSSSGIYHVAIFAGGNSIIHASKPGVPVTRAQIWTRAVSFGRVR